MPPEDRIRLLHMIEAAEAIANFIKGRKRDELDGDTMLLFALVRGIEVFGEAASGVSPPTKAEIPTLPWPQIVATRNRLIHAYFDVDKDILWKAATEEIPAIVPKLRELTRE
jgi:uncharacterized protein with HEPN domain